MRQVQAERGRLQACDSCGHHADRHELADLIAGPCNVHGMLAWYMTCHAIVTGPLGLAPCSCHHFKIDETSGVPPGLAHPG